MKEQKCKISTKTALSYALLLITLCVLLVGTITFARYSWEFMQASYQFLPQSQLALTVYDGHITQETGALKPASTVWERVGDQAVLQFGVANGKPEEFAREDRGFAIRLAAGLSIEDPAALTVSLSYIDESGETVTLTGVPETIVEGSIQQAVFGDGWVYRFFENGEELRFSLKGNAFQYENFTVTVTGSVPATLLDLQITQLQ